MLFFMGNDINSLTQPEIDSEVMLHMIGCRIATSQNDLTLSFLTSTKIDEKYGIIVK